MKCSAGQQSWAEDRREREEGRQLLSFGSLLLLPPSQHYCIPWLNAAHGSKVPLTGGKKRGSCQALNLYVSSFPAPVHPLTECSAGEQCAIYWRMGAREGKLPSSGSSSQQFVDCTGHFRIKKTWLLSSRNSTTLVHRLLSCNTRHNPWTSGALFMVISSHAFLILDNPFNLHSIFFFF